MMDKKSLNYITVNVYQSGSTSIVIDTLLQEYMFWLHAFFQITMVCGPMYVHLNYFTENLLPHQ